MENIPNEVIYMELQQQYLKKRGRFKFFFQNHGLELAKRKMIQLLHEFWRIMKQMQGKENMFGYQTTTANQLYLLCCFCGKFYFSEKIHPQMKYFWFLINFSGLMTAFAILLGYFLYDTRQDYVLQLTVINAVSTCVNLVVTFPMVLYYHRRGVESMIRGVDEILEHKSRTHLQKRNIRISVKWMLICNILVIFAMSVIYGFAPFLDVMMFFEEQKLKDPVYYILPLPNVHEYGCMEWFLASAAVVSMYYSLFSLEWLAMTNFIVFWGITCHNEMLLLHDQLNLQMHNLYVEMNREYETSSKRWNKEFDSILRKHIDDYRKITRVIEDFRGFAELFCTTAIPVNFFIQVVQPYVIISRDMIFCVRLKGIAYQVIAGWPMFLMYWTGQVIENGISAVSFSVYSVPWYWSVRARKDTYIFLHRTQCMKSVVMLKVYPLVLRNYSRLAHSVLSSVNMLRTLARKVKNA